MDSTFDYVICGGGTAGCVLASRLKEGNPNLSIAVVERGPEEQNNSLVLNPLAVSQLETLGVDQAYYSEPQSHLAQRQIPLHAGNILSGSSAINYGLWMRGHSKDYDRWAELVKDDRWSYEGLLPYFKRTETHHNPNGNKDAHGFEGPMKTTAGRQYPLRQPLHDALVEIGLSDNADANGGDPLGISVYTENWSPTRQPSAVTYDLAGVEVIANTTIRRISLEDASSDGSARATGVELDDGRYIQAKKEVMLCCGAHRTPQVLMLSGMGPRSELSKLGIDTIVDNPEVGSNLFDHLASHVCWKLDSKVAETGLAMGSQEFHSNPEYMEGLPVDWMTIGSLPSQDLKAALGNDENSTGVDDHHLLNNRAHYWIMVTYMPLGLGDGYDVAVDGKHITTTALHLQPTSRGKVLLSSTNPRDNPMVDPCYNSTKHDRYAMGAALKQSLNLADADGLKPYIEGEEAPAGLAPLTSAASDSEIGYRIRKYATTINHAAGTAAMGKVVDSELKVNGVIGLRVCDASVFPGPISAGPQATVYAIAEQLADMILSGQQKS